MNTCICCRTSGSRLDYCDALFSRCNTCIENLQLIQNGMARALTRTKHYERVSPILALDPFEKILKHSSVALLQQILKTYLSLTTPVDPWSQMLVSLWSGLENQNLLYAFCYRVPFLWNKAQEDTLSTLKSVFMTLFKAFLLTAPHGRDGARWMITSHGAY